MVEDIDEVLKLERCKVLKTGLSFNVDTYEYDDKFIPGSGSNGVHTTFELLSLLESDSSVDIDTRILCLDKVTRRCSYKKLSRQEFIEAFKKEEKWSFKETLDPFATDYDFDTQAGRVGEDFVPLLSGPFYKQLYYYDYLRMHAASFHAYHHDPIANGVVRIITDFTLGRGWRVDCDNPIALALWRTFEEVNDLYTMMHYADDELSIYGEIMIWELPNLETKIGYRLEPGQAVPRGTIPRVRLIDPSVIWEIVTYPEDITRVLHYTWVAPTQYQMYTDGKVPGSKFIYQQIPADQITHVKINSVSNEKRGRSILFPILGYLKRLRDSVNYSILAQQKASAWSMDTTIEGSQSDIDQYVLDQQGLGTIPPAGSEFVHTAKIKRDYLSNQASARGGNSNSFDWCLSMIAAGTGIPVNYLGTHLSGGQTRASAIVATEPVAKMFERRQLVLEMILKRMADKLFKRFGFDGVDIEVTFPTIVEQDRSSKLKDLLVAEEAGWISKERAATIAAKELSITEFEYEEEKEDIASGIEPMDVAPLTKPGMAPAEPSAEPSAITQPEKRSLSLNRGA